jgi:hypothetical protein
MRAAGTIGIAAIGDRSLASREAMIASKQARIAGLSFVALLRPARPRAAGPIC